MKDEFDLPKTEQRQGIYQRSDQGSVMASEEPAPYDDPTVKSLKSLAQDLGEESRMEAAERVQQLRIEALRAAVRTEGSPTLSRTAENILSDAEMYRKWLETGET